MKSFKLEMSVYKKAIKIQKVKFLLKMISLLPGLTERGKRRRKRQNHKNIPLY